MSAPTTFSLGGTYILAACAAARLAAESCELVTESQHATARVAGLCLAAACCLHLARQSLRDHEASTPFARKGAALALRGALETLFAARGASLWAFEPALRDQIRIAIDFTRTAIEKLEAFATAPTVDVDFLNEVFAVTDVLDERDERHTA